MHETHKCSRSLASKEFNYNCSESAPLCVRKLNPCHVVTPTRNNRALTAGFYFLSLSFSLLFFQEKENSCPQDFFRDRDLSKAVRLFQSWVTRPVTPYDTDYKWKFNVFLKIGLTGKYFSVEIEEEMKGGGKRVAHVHIRARSWSFVGEMFIERIRMRCNAMTVRFDQFSLPVERRLCENWEEMGKWDNFLTW